MLIENKGYGFNFVGLFVFKHLIDNSNKFLIAQPFKWIGGSAICFVIAESIETHGYKVLYEACYWDRDYPDLITILGILVNGDARGKYASDLVMDIFYKTFLEDDTFKKYFKEFYERIKNQKEEK